MANHPRLILMRHAKAEAPGFGQADVDRGLTERGLADAPRMGQWLAAKGFKPDTALVSPARRTQLTWQGVCRGGGFASSQQDEPLIYEASIHTLLGLVQGQSALCVMLVGHNPACSDLLRYVVEEGGLRDEYAKLMPTAAVYVIDFAVPWAEIGAGTGRIVAHARPKALPDDFIGPQSERSEEDRLS